MVTKNASLLVPNQLPEFIANDSPAFIEFLKAYYEFLTGYLAKVEELRDIDHMPPALLDFFRREFLSKFPKAQINDKKFITIVRDLYRAKGTTNAVELLFRIFFNEAIIVYQPNSNILRASDGKWIQETSIALKKVYGSIDFNSPIILKVENDNGIFYIEVDRYEIVDSDTTRFYYKSFRQIIYTTPQYVDIVDSNDEITYRGLLVKSPSTIEIFDGGEGWKLGQIIVIPGTTTPTIARTIKISNSGELQAVEIVQRGYDHSENQSIVVSPYKNRPTGATFTINSVVTAVVAGPSGPTPIYTHYLELLSFVEDVSESIVGYSNSQDPRSYFFEDYSDRTYSQWIAFTQDFGIPAYATSTVTIPDITTEEWLASRATLIYKYDYVVTERGYFFGDTGQISNTNIRMQDNYFYQLFSYVIESTRQVEEYRSLLNMIHPAGLKFFSDLAKTAIVYSDPLAIERTISFEKVFLFENLTILSNELAKFVTKNISESILYEQIASEITRKEVIKPLSTNAAAVIQAPVFDVNKPLPTFEVILTDPRPDFSATKALSTPIAFPTDRIESFAVDKTLATAQSIGDSSLQKDINKLLEITASVTHQTPVTSYVTFNSEGYFAEIFSQDEHFVNIG